LEFVHHCSDILLGNFNALVLTAAGDGEICKVRHLHEPNLNAITRESINPVFVTKLGVTIWKKSWSQSATVRHVAS